MENPKDNEDSQTTGDGESAATKEARNACQATRDLSHEREARGHREMAKAHVHYQALLNERSTAAMPTKL